MTVLLEVCRLVYCVEWLRLCLVVRHLRESGREITVIYCAAFGWEWGNFLWNYPRHHCGVDWLC